MDIIVILGLALSFFCAGWIVRDGWVRQLQAENADLKRELTRLTDRDPKTGRFIKAEL